VTKKPQTVLAHHDIAIEPEQDAELHRASISTASSGTRR
jgi:hypothetical protein